MKHAAVLLVVLVTVLMPSLAPAAENKRPMSVEDLFRFKRVADPQVSPDGKTVAYVVTDVSLEENKTNADIWLAASDGGSPPRQLTASPKADRHPRWSPDGKRILFESNRSGENQLWIINLDGGEARQLTTIATDAGNAIWSPDGKWIAFVSAVYPEHSNKPYKESNELNKKRKEEAEKSPVKARTFTKLFFRHWDEYVEDKRQHLFVIAAPPPVRSANEVGADPRDVTPGDRDGYPTSMTFSSSVDFSFSPDSKYLVFTAPPERDEAWSTNYDIWRVPIDASAKPENLTKDNLAADSGPQFSPDGKRLAYRAQKKPYSEADKWELMVVEASPDGSWKGKPKSVTAESDRSSNEFVWRQNDMLVFTADEEGSVRVFWTSVMNPSITRLEHIAGQNGALSMRRDVLAFTNARMDRPPEVFIMEGWILVGGQAVNLTQTNTKVLAELDLPRPESVTVPGAGGTPMQMWILKPPGFDPKKKWPLVYLVHGGPQSAWEDGWSFRWCPELWAAQGYVVALANPRGSTGFGQKYVDEISGDWGGKCYDDLMAGVDYLEKQPYIDKERMAAAGASFGGYMMNWFAVNTGRFKCLITHCSVWNFESMWGTTDELWFDEYEHGGLPWEKPGHYAQFSPHKKAGNLAKFKTPMLVIHNDLDFRCPIGQGHELFTALQRQGVPSRMINFPDETHWVLKPRNSEYWHKEVFAWLTKHVPAGK